MLRTALGALLAAAAAGAPDPLVRHLGALPIPNIAMLSFAPDFPGSASPCLLVTTFSPIADDTLLVIRDLAGLVNGRPANLSVLLYNLVWPNYAVPVPPAVFGEPAVMVAGGFLIPGKTTGKVVVALLSSGRTLQLSHDKAGFFYHQAEWADVNNDGRLDVLTARASRPVLAAAEAEMVWLEQPIVATEVPWPERRLFAGPGHSFVFDDWTHGAVAAPQIVSAGFFAEKDLALYVCAIGPWSACLNPLKIVIDDSLGPYFDVHKVDLNGDGRPDLLVSNNRADGRGAVLAYEAPESGKLDDPWRRHLLADGYAPQRTLPFPGKGAPGITQAFPPYGGTRKPWVLVSGDDAGVVHLLIPKSQNPKDWNYSVKTIYQGKGTIGGVAAQDIDGDARAELFVADYTSGRLEVFSVEPPGPEA